MPLWGMMVGWDYVNGWNLGLVSCVVIDFV